MRYNRGYNEYNYKAYISLLRRARNVCQKNPELKKKFNSLIKKIKYLLASGWIQYPIPKSDVDILETHLNQEISIIEAEIRESVKIQRERRSKLHPSGWEDRNYEVTYMMVLKNIKFGAPLEKATVTELKLSYGHTLLGEIAFTGMLRPKVKVRCVGWLKKEKMGYFLENISQFEYIS